MGGGRWGGNIECRRQRSGEGSQREIFRSWGFCGKVYIAYSWKEVSILSLCVPHIYLQRSSEVLHDVKLLLEFPLSFASSSSVKARYGIQIGSWILNNCHQW